MRGIKESAISLKQILRKKYNFKINIEFSSGSISGSGNIQQDFDNTLKK